MMYMLSSILKLMQFSVVSALNCQFICLKFWFCQIMQRMWKLNCIYL